MSMKICMECVHCKYQGMPAQNNWSYLCTKLTYDEAVNPISGHSGFTNGASFVLDRKHPYCSEWNSKGDCEWWEARDVSSKSSR